MSDDDRMDRAERIREMREGDRSNDEVSDDSTADDSEDTEMTADDGEDTEMTADEVESEQIAETDAAAGDDDTTDAAAGDDAAGDDATDATDSDGEGPATRSGTEAPSEMTDTDEHAADTATDTSEQADQTADEDDDATLHIPGADVGDVDIDVEEMAEQADLTSVGDDGSDDADGPTGIEKEGTADVVQQSTAETRVLEFGLADERYCLDIEYIEEIVKRETVTRVPNTPDYVEGVVDLRGQITTIIDPKVPLEIDHEGGKELIVVFDPEEFEEQGAIGWVVDDVNQVMPITDDEVNDPPLEEEHIIGVVDRDDEFVIWTTPDVALDEAAG